MGYARVWTTDRQDTYVQMDVQGQATAERVFEEHAPGGRWDRPRLNRMIDFLRPGDTVVVWRLEQLSRSLQGLLHIMERIGSRQGGFRGVTEAVNTTAPVGRMRMQLLDSFAEFERDMNRETTRIDLEAARARGVRLRRPES